jgi:Protein of unknown function (DUF1592)/Protein of unknown function (DUF1588)/Protein of unknown function (DUF1595)/Protein of unknown function (DUF1585)/Protein of unknown function (DUF1587)
MVYQPRQLRSGPMIPRPLTLAACKASFLLLGACTGTVGSGTQPSSASSPGEGASASTGSVVVSGASGATSGSSAGSSTSVNSSSGAGTPTDAPPAASLHLLTSAQFANSVQDLLGAAAPLGPVQPDDVVDDFAQVGASSLVVSPSGVALYETATGTATAWAFADAAHAAAVLSCVPQTVTDSACFSSGLAAFGRRAFRRSLTTDETSRFVTLATTIASQTSATVLMGLRHAVWAILQSPSFLYRVELGVASAADAGRLKYTSYEMSSRLASALWNSVPDDTLLDAAAGNQLDTADGVTAQAERMVADPRASRAVVAFVDDLYGMSNLEEATKDPTLFPTWTPTIQAEMKQELELRVVDMVLTEPGDFLSLYDGTTTFVNGDLATYYGLTGASTSSFGKVQLPAGGPRAGLLGAGAILAAYGLPQRTSPTTRGKFVNDAILCRSIPPPPPGVPPLPPSLAPNTTLREQLVAHRAAPQCASCHSIMDPIGFGMEYFNTAGLYRTTDNGQPIDATGTLDGASFNGLAQLGAVLRKDALSAPCVVTKNYTNAQGRAPTDWDTAALNALTAQFTASGNRADKLLVNLVSSDAFRFVQPSQL